MKRVYLCLLGSVAVALVAFAITRWVCTPHHLQESDQLAWLQAEFKLSPAQLAAVKTLQDNYQPVCRAHCTNIQQAQAVLANAPAHGASAARAELARMEAVCREATRAHLQQVAAVMDPVEGTRFLALVLPKLSGQTHDAPCGLQ